MNIHFDLDGTLIDVSHRHYAVYSAIAQALGFSPLSAARYWSMKRVRTPLAQVLAQSGATRHRDRFEAMWLALIEQDRYLEKDTLLPQTLAVLKQLRRKNTLLLITLRHSRRALARQLDRLKLTRMFDNVISGAPTGATPKFKVSLIRQYSRPDDWLVGDTEADIIAAKTLGLISCAVTTGLRSRDFLSVLKPDYVIDSIAGLSAAIDSAISANCRG
jgi:phosphoglycolate phosphatase-like HAD superfamily hydrolase